MVTTAGEVAVGDRLLVDTEPVEWSPPAAAPRVSGDGEVSIYSIDEGAARIFRGEPGFAVVVRREVSVDVKRTWVLETSRTTFPHVVFGERLEHGEALTVVPLDDLRTVVRERDEARDEVERWEHAAGASELDREAAEERVRVLAEALKRGVNVADNAETHAGNSGNHTLAESYKREGEAMRAALASVADSDPEGADHKAIPKDASGLAPCATCGAPRASSRVDWPCQAPASSSGGVTPEPLTECLDAEAIERIVRRRAGVLDALAPNDGGVTPEGRGEAHQHRLRFEWDGDSEWPTVSLVCPPGRAGCVPPVCEHGEQTGCEFGCQPSKEPCWIETWEGADVHDITGVVEVPVSVTSADNGSAPEFTIVGPPVSYATREGRECEACPRPATVDAHGDGEHFGLCATCALALRDAQVAAASPPVSSAAVDEGGEADPRLVDAKRLAHLRAGLEHPEFPAIGRNGVRMLLDHIDALNEAATASASGGEGK